MKSRRAFTLVELLVVIAIIGLLSTMAVVATGSARMSAKNTQRKANLVQVSKALELYYNDNGAYPSTGGISNWHGNCTIYQGLPDSGAGAWIPNFQNYMTTLPHDPDTNNSHSSYSPCLLTPTMACYIYTSNSTDYKLLAHCTPEGSNIGSDLMADPGRSAYSYSVYSPGARGW